MIIISKFFISTHPAKVQKKMIISTICGCTCILSKGSKYKLGYKLGIKVCNGKDNTDGLPDPPVPQKLCCMIFPFLSISLIYSHTFFTISEAFSKHRILCDLFK